MLRALALGSCHGTVSVIKQVIPPGGTIATAAPAPGWTFGATTTAAGVTIDPTSGRDRRHRWGQLQPHVPGWGHHRSGHGDRDPDSPATRSSNRAAQRHVHEPQHPASPRPDHQRRGLSGSRSPPIRPIRSAASSTTRHRSRPPPSRSTSSGSSTGRRYANGAQPPGLSAQPTIDGTTGPFGSVVPGFTPGPEVAINETVTTLLPLCTSTSQTVTLANGAPVIAAAAVQRHPRRRVRTRTGSPTSSPARPASS